MRRANRGFTLIELMVTIGVSAILVSIAVPNMAGMVNNSRLRAATNETLAVFQTARLEAIRGNRPVVVCMTANPDTAAGAGGCLANEATARGWLVLQDTTRAAPTTLTVIRRASMPGAIQMKSSDSLKYTSAMAKGLSSGGVGVVFSADGMAHAAAGSSALLNAAVSLCLPVKQPSDNSRRVVIGSGGRVRYNPVGTAGNCNTTVKDDGT
jgi:type IV fimbrial biogenesis protein FimT